MLKDLEFVCTCVCVCVREREFVVGPSLEVITEEMTRLQKFPTVDIPQLIEILEKVRASPYCTYSPAPHAMYIMCGRFLCLCTVCACACVCLYPCLTVCPCLLITCVLFFLILCVCVCVCALGVGAVGDEYDALHNHDPKPQEGS